MYKWFKRIALFIVSLLLLSAVTAGLFIYITLQYIQGRDHVRDDVLVQQLNEDIDQYELLIKMFREDAPASVVHPTWINPDDVIGPERWQEYKEIFGRLELDGGMRSWGGDSIWFISTAQGMVTGGSMKGYMYSPENPDPLYTNLDQIPDDLESNVWAYKKINNDWYITFVWDD